MAWNDPDDNKNRDPWNNGGNRGNGGPPDLDELLKKLTDNIKGLFGGGKKGGSDNNGGLPFLLIAVIALVVWALSGFYIIDESERGVVLKFGKYQTTTLPGPHWYARFIQSIEKVNVTVERQIAERDLSMLTQDENIVDIDFGVQYVINDPAAYLFSVHEPDLTVVQAAQSAIREIVGKNNMDYTILDGRADLANRAKSLAQDILDNYKIGITIQRFNLTRSQAPSQVRDAFDDAIQAREDEKSYKNQAEAYRNEIVPLARGEATRQIEEAKAYKVSVVKRSEGEADRFSKLYQEYKKAPRVTRERLYLDAVESVLSNSTKVMMDVEGGNNIMYLPLDQIIQKSSATRNSSSRNSQSLPSSDQSFGSNRDTLRTRESR